MTPDKVKRIAADNPDNDLWQAIAMLVSLALAKKAPTGSAKKAPHQVSPK